MKQLAALFMIAVIGFVGYDVYERVKTKQGNEDVAMTRLYRMMASDCADGDTQACRARDAMYRSNPGLQEAFDIVYQRR